MSLGALTPLEGASDEPFREDEMVFPLEPFHNHSSIAVETAWSAPFVLADNPDLPDQNPVMLIDSKGVLWLWWMSSLDNTSATYMRKFKTSTACAGERAPERPVRS